MKKLVFLMCLLVLGQNVRATQYLFFLHNKFLELYPPEASHSDYGKCEYREIISAFEKQGFTVISELRPKDTDAKAYAIKVARQIDSLMARGVKPDNITVVGTSKGGYIAQYVSGNLKNDKVNYVFIGCCSKEDLEEMPDINYCGNILSIYEKSDVIGQSCQPMKDRSRCKVSRFNEIELNTGLKHGFLYKASSAWIEPSVNWAKHIYE